MEEEDEERRVHRTVERGRVNKILRKCLIVNSIILWVGGAFFLLIGTFAYSFLKRLFMDWEGLRYAVEFPVVSILLGTFTVLMSFWINYILIFPTRKRYHIVCGILAVIFLFELIYFAIRVDYSKKVQDIISKGFRYGMLNYRDGFASALEINLIQSSLKCCGFKNYKDWFETTWANGRVEVPASCCIDLKQCHNLEPVMVDDIYLEGCKEQLRSTTKTIGTFLPLTFVLISIINLLCGIVFTLTLGIKEGTKLQPRLQRGREIVTDSQLLRSSTQLIRRSSTL